MGQFNWFDIVLAIIIIISAAAGLKTGFARVVIGLAATVVGLVAGFWFYRMAAAEILKHFGMSLSAANILGFLAIFLAVMFVGSLMASLLARIFRWFGLSWFDHFMGGIAGFVRGVLVIAALADVLIAFVSPMPIFLQNSRMLPYASELVSTLAQLAPHELKDSFNDQMDALRHFWHGPEQTPHANAI